MKFAYTMLSILVTLFLVSGCSEEIPDNHENKNVVRKAIQKPVKARDNWKETKEEIADIVNKDIDNRIIKETLKESPLPVQEENIYITKEGDTLAGISGKAHIYNNPLKWPLLYRDNPDALASIKDKENLYEAVLPAGIKFKILTETEVEKNLENRSGINYVANLISSPYLKEITPQVIRLTDAGYFVYITSAVVNGKEWYRLRAGFYKSRSEANRAGEEIKNHLNIPDIWTAKVGDEEFHEFGGY
jgi:hypothetical protein